MGGFQLDKQKHIQKSDVYSAYVWGNTTQTMKDEGMRTYAQNFGEAFENWQVNDQKEEDYKQELEKYQSVVAQRTALVDQELSPQEEAEIRELQIKAKKKNWSEDKLQGKVDVVKKKYAEIRAQKVRVIEKEEEVVLKKNQAPLVQKLNNRANEIDQIMDKQNTNELERGLLRQFDKTYQKKDGQKNAELTSLRFYSMNSGYKVINGALRAGRHLIETIVGKVIRKSGVEEKTSFKVSTAKLTRNMLRSIERFSLEKDTVLFRNSDLSSLRRFLELNEEKMDTAEDLFRALKKKENSTVNGMLGVDRAFLSTTIEKGGTEDFRNMQVEYRILAPQGTKGTYMAPASEYKSEKEFLLQAGTMFRVLKVAKQGTYHPQRDIYNKKTVGPDDSDDKIVVYMEAIQKNAVKKGDINSA